MQLHNCTTAASGCQTERNEEKHLHHHCRDSIITNIYISVTGVRAVDLKLFTE